MKVRIDKSKCIGCGTCVALAGQIFRLNEENIATVIRQPKGAQEEALVEKAQSFCPSGAIIINKEEK